jgi:hypothetical protein
LPLYMTFAGRSGGARLTTVLPHAEALALHCFTA